MLAQSLRYIVNASLSNLLLSMLLSNHVSVAIIISSCVVSSRFLYSPFFPTKDWQLTFRILEMVGIWQIMRYEWAGWHYCCLLSPYFQLRFGSFQSTIFKLVCNSYHSRRCRWVVCCVASWTKPYYTAMSQVSTFFRCLTNTSTVKLMFTYFTESCLFISFSWMLASRDK